jgi:hypothetical protein
MTLVLDSVRVEVTVSGHAEPVEGLAFAAHVERLAAADLQAAPLASERFQAALPLVPGVVRGPDGQINVNGAMASQSGWRFNSANASDPVTGEDAIDVPIDAVSVVQVRGTAYAPEFGQSVGAVTTVETQSGGDAWHFQVNDLEPRLRRRAGEWRGIESWTPRGTVGGPIVKGRLSLLQSVQYEYSQNRVFGLPPFQSDTEVRSAESFSRADWTLSPSTRLSGSVTVAPRKTTYAGLNTFNPQSVTPSIENHGVLGTATETIVLGGSGLFETTVSVKAFDAAIYPSSGRAAMVLAPDLNSGSYFNEQDRTSRRGEWLNTYSLTPFGEAHLLKIGAGVTYETFDGTSRSGPVEIVRADGTLSELTTYVGNTALGRNRTAFLAYGQDTWTVSPRVTAQFGGRLDHDSITGGLHLAPRGSVSAVLTGDGRTVLRAGAGLFYAAIPLNVASFDQMQERVITQYGITRATPLGPATVLANVVNGELRAPRSTNWNVEIDREWIRNLFVRVGYRQRDNRSEAVVTPSVTAAAAPILELRTDGRSQYREGQVTARYQLHGTDQIVGSYTRSSAIGNLNDFNSYFGNIENPVIRPDERAALPWDVPHRWLMWANVGLPRQFAIFPVLEVRSGFPTSTLDADRDFVGARNAGRFPTFVSLDVQISKRFRIFNHNATIGLKVFNLTNHFNPRDYQGNLASSNVGGFSNEVGRAFRGKWVMEL